MATEGFELQESILNEFPYPIVIRYRQMLEATELESKARRAFSVLEAGLRAFALGLLDQYLMRDLEAVSDDDLNLQAWHLIARSRKLKTWKNMFFTLLQAYGGHRQRFFMPELYDFYWDASVQPHRAWPGIQEPFDRLVELRNDVSHAPPDTPEAWQSLFDETNTLLHQVLEQFLFITDYDLIYVVSKENDGYIYKTYTGQQVIRAEELLQTERQLKENWCYLSKTSGELLSLHPLILFWESESEMVDRFVELVVEKLRAQLPKRRISRLDWNDLKLLADHVVLQRMGDVRTKYNPHLYFQRNEVREIFDEYLRSDKTGLILTGSSGVGKSNFILSILDEFEDAESPVCALAYNGGRLEPDKPLADTIAHDFNIHFKIKQQETIEGSAVLQMIDDLDGIKERQLIIFIDALNENPDGKALLQQIDSFIENYPYPWLKVVMTSRPEAWLSIKRGIPLSENRYFRPTDKEELAKEMAGYSYTDLDFPVKPFEYEELPRVYAKYREHYELKTDYNTLSPKLKRRLRDPLTLLLVSNIHHKAEIPPDIRTSELVENYVQMLKRTGLLEEPDLAFLRQQIVPRLFQPPDYKNRIIPEEVEFESAFYERIFNYDRMSSGRWVNQSFVNLADSVILTNSEQAVEFQYERFYEYFGGEYLAATASNSKNLLDYYRTLGEALDDKPYLWGALKNALIVELKNKNIALIYRLAQSVTPTSRLLRNAIVVSLVEFAEIDLKVVTSLTNEMLQPLYGPAKDIAETIKRLVLRNRYDALQLKPEQAIALEITGRLGLEELLSQAAADRIGAVRQAAVLNAFYLWREKPEAGYRILDQLGEYTVAGWNLPDLGAADSLMSLASSIITYDHLNPEAQNQVFQVVRRVLRKLLFLNPEEHNKMIGQVRYAIWGQIRRPLLSAGISWGLRLISSWGTEKLPANPETLANFFMLSEQEKDLVVPLIPYFDPYKLGLPDQVEEIIEGEKTGDFLLLNIIGAPLIARARVNYDEGVETLRELVNRRLSQEPSGSRIEAYAWDALQMALRQEHPDPELFDLGKRCVLAIQKEPSLFLKSHNEEIAVPYLKSAAGIGVYMMLSTLYEGESIPPEVRGWIDRAIEQDDVTYLLNVAYELEFAFDMGFHKVPLDGLQLLAKYPDDDVQDAVTKLLIRVRHYFPEDVEDILLRDVFPETVNQQVWASSPVEHVSDLLGMRAVGILYDLFLLGPKELRQETIWIADQARKMRDLQSWLALLLKALLNLTVGEVIFPVPGDQSKPGANH